MVHDNPSPDEETCPDHYDTLVASYMCAALVLFMASAAAKYYYCEPHTQRHPVRTQPTYIAALNSQPLRLLMQPGQNPNHNLATHNPPDYSPRTRCTGGRRPEADVLRRGRQSLSADGHCVLGAAYRCHHRARVWWVALPHLAILSSPPSPTSIQQP